MYYRIKKPPRGQGNQTQFWKTCSRQTLREKCHPAAFILQISIQCSIDANSHPFVLHSGNATRHHGDTLVWECAASMKHKPGRMPPIAKKAKK